MRDFKKLNVWLKSHTLTLSVYKTSKTFPKEELYGLTSQIRRSAISIPSNIAEGCGRRSPNELAQFLVIAHGSATELEYQLYLANELDYISGPSYQDLDAELTEIKKMLNAFIQKIKS